MTALSLDLAPSLHRHESGVYYSDQQPCTILSLPMSISNGSKRSVTLSHQIEVTVPPTKLLTSITDFRYSQMEVTDGERNRWCIDGALQKHFKLASIIFWLPQYVPLTQCLKTFSGATVASSVTDQHCIHRISITLCTKFGCNLFIL